VLTELRALVDGFVRENDSLVNYQEPPTFIAATTAISRKITHKRSV